MFLKVPAGTFFIAFLWPKYLVSWLNTFDLINQKINVYDSITHEHYFTLEAMHGTAKAIHAFCMWLKASKYANCYSMLLDSFSEEDGISKAYTFNTNGLHLILEYSI